MAKKKSKTPRQAIVNRRARFDYQLGDELVAGLALTGPEVRAARDGHVQLKGAYVNISKDELWLIGANFSLKLNDKNGGRTVDDDPRKLLVHKKQLDSLRAKRKEGLTIVPLRLLNRQNHIKLVIALGKGKKTYDKRQTIKERDVKRDIDRDLKSR